jgi:hypothetical protein
VVAWVSCVWHVEGRRDDSELALALTWPFIAGVGLARTFGAVVGAIGAILGYVGGDMASGASIGADVAVWLRRWADTAGCSVTS